MDRKAMTAGVVILILVLIGGGLLLSNPGANPAADEVETSATPTPLATDTSAEDADSAARVDPGGVQEFTVNGDNFAFSLTEMRVKKGDTVRITFNNTEGTHDLRIDEFSVGTRTLSPGASETIEFTADQAGSFEYYCSVSNHRQMGMKGALIVEE